MTDARQDKPSEQPWSGNNEQVCGIRGCEQQATLTDLMACVHPAGGLMYFERHWCDEHRYLAEVRGPESVR